MSGKMEPKWADPNPAGSLLIACLLIATGALFVGFVPSSCTPLVMVNSIMVGITLLIIAIISFKNGDIMGGTLNFVFGTIFAIGLSSSGLAQYVIPYFLGSVSNGALIAPVAKIPSHANGWIVLPAAVVMLFMAIIALRMSSLLVVWMVSFSIALGFTGAWMMMGSPGITDPSLPISNPIIKISGWLFLACGIAMLYIGFAGLINTIAGRIVLPLGHPLIKQPCPVNKTAVPHADRLRS
ncbi:MAG: hypothetical protein PHU49_00690 [Syntrophorhabdaceae bacterium]|nr:hypothetical protein [Syntrophorhabdaceae bacterium]MDD5242509.1 hypothetical protein [Syntrophorhabdaceae bacterium]